MKWEEVVARMSVTVILVGVFLAVVTYAQSWGMKIALVGLFGLMLTAAWSAE